MNLISKSFSVSSILTFTLWIVVVSNTASITLPSSIISFAKALTITHITVASDRGGRIAVTS